MALTPDWKGVSAAFEYAVRAGSTTRYPWGDEVGENNANCNSCKSHGAGRLIQAQRPGGPRRFVELRSWGPPLRRPRQEHVGSRDPALGFRLARTLSP